MGPFFMIARSFSTQLRLCCLMTPATQTGMIHPFFIRYQ
ncbi:MAG: hypothetical protein ACJAXR_002324 [Halopseudomonas sp.]|jgi:hypothetical protein